MNFDVYAAQETLIDAALRVINSDRADEGPYKDAEQEYAREMLDAAAKNLVHVLKEDAK